MSFNTERYPVFSQAGASNSIFHRFLFSHEDPYVIIISAFSLFPSYSALLLMPQMRAAYKCGTTENGNYQALKRYKIYSQEENNRPNTNYIRGKLLWLYMCFQSFWTDMDEFTPQLQIPITTQSGQRRHMELVQWWAAFLKKKKKSKWSFWCVFANIPVFSWYIHSVNRPVCTEEDTTASPRTETPSKGWGRGGRLSWTLGLTGYELLNLRNVDVWCLLHKLVFREQPDWRYKSSRTHSPSILLKHTEEDAFIDSCLKPLTEFYFGEFKKKKR